MLWKIVLRCGIMGKVPAITEDKQVVNLWIRRRMIRGFGDTGWIVKTCQLRIRCDEQMNKEQPGIRLRRIKWSRK